MLKIKTDSRKVKNGDTFVALRGINSDGHDYIESAIKNGAVKIVAEEGSYSVQTVIVDDSRKYLEEFLYDEYKSYLEDMKIIGITGTNGKTTTSYLLYEALNRLKVNTSYIGTVGFYKKEKVKDLPNTSPDICDIYDILVDSYESGYKTVVMEVSSQGLSYGRLNKIPFDYAVFTNLTQDHLDYHGTMENYAKAKQQLFYQLKKDGISVINIDDSYHSYYEIGDTRTYGFAGSDYQIKNMELNRCSRCGNFYVAEGNVCPKCSTKDGFEFSTFKSYIQENGLENSLNTISNNTGISVKNLNRFMGYQEFQNYQQELNSIEKLKNAIGELGNN